MATEERKPKVGMVIVFREDLGSELAPGLIQRVFKKEDTADVSDVVRVVVFPYGDGANEWEAKYSKGCEYAYSWCYPEEVE